MKTQSPKDKTKSVEPILMDDPSFTMGPSYFAHEAWYEVTRSREYHTEGIPLWILIINSYGRLRKLFPETGGYEDISDGGSI